MSSDVIVKLEEMRGEFSNEISNLRMEIILTKKENLNLVEACAFLGIRKGTLYLWVSQRKVPFFKRAKLLFFKRSELEAWVFDEQYRYKSTSEIKKETKNNE